ncbi:MAG TPA: lipocalin-like domain-containing protein [Polyangiales bacterium]
MTDPRIERMAGCWELVDATLTLPDGSVQRPWGEPPNGRIICTSAGEFSAHVSKSQRAKFADEWPTPEEKQTAYDDHIAYFGEIMRLDDESSTMISYVRGATNASWIGGEQLRYIEAIDDERFTLRAPTVTLGGLDFVARFVWARSGRR